MPHDLPRRIARLRDQVEARGLATTTNDQLHAEQRAIRALSDADLAEARELLETFIRTPGNDALLVVAWFARRDIIVDLDEYRQRRAARTRGWWPDAS